MQPDPKARLLLTTHFKPAEAEIVFRVLDVIRKEEGPEIIPPAMIVPVIVDKPGHPPISLWGVMLADEIPEDRKVVLLRQLLMELINSMLAENVRWEVVRARSGHQRALFPDLKVN